MKPGRSGPPGVVTAATAAPVDRKVRDQELLGVRQAAQAQLRHGEEVEVHALLEVAGVGPVVPGNRQVAPTHGSKNEAGVPSVGWTAPGRSRPADRRKV